jgi:hypothetical protein
MCFGFNRQLLTCLFRTVARNGWMQIETQSGNADKGKRGCAIHPLSCYLGFVLYFPVFVTHHIAMGATQ